MLPDIKKNINDYLFELREYRFDKTKPNTNKVVSNIYHLHKFNWSNKLNDGNNFSIIELIMKLQNSKEIIFVKIT